MAGFFSVGAASLLLVFAEGPLATASAGGMGGVVMVALAYQGITYTTREKIIDLGPLKASVDKEKNIPLPPIVGALALAGGMILVIVGARKS